MDAVEELTQLSESMRQVASLLADDDPCDDSAPRRLSTFVNAVALGNVKYCIWAELYGLKKSVELCGLKKLYGLEKYMG
uniref:Uncharacterized protein n=2 Tax=Oryza sativa subsp. japonica TaxID=39947 RepID=Q8SB02_ORYSJ|nr:Putative dynamin-like protein [Oryza sativa]ABB46974.2 hypothetical protein LOC_Os10g10580 [Oryza sativa Japonica Group]